MARCNGDGAQARAVVIPTHCIVSIGHVVLIEILQHIVIITVQPLCIATRFHTLGLRSFLEKDGAFPKCAIRLIGLIGSVFDHDGVAVGDVQSNRAVEFVQEAWSSAAGNGDEVSKRRE